MWIDGLGSRCRYLMLMNISLFYIHLNIHVEYFDVAMNLIAVIGNVDWT